MLSRYCSTLIIRYWKKFNKAYHHQNHYHVTSLREKMCKNTGLMTFSLAGLFSFGSSFDQNDNYNSNFEFMAEPISSKQELLNFAQKGSMRHRFEVFVMQMQTDFCNALQSMENKFTDEIDESKIKRFQVDRWTREEGGGGVTCIMQDSSVFEKAGVNISIVHGFLPPQAAQQMRSRGKKLAENEQLVFFAAGVSSVVHPRNPNVPTIHFNFRYFEISSNNNDDKQWWFGGGTDMTPYILNEHDAQHFHRELKKACDKHDKSYYNKFKKWCDDYFFINHRNERRGIGGLFFDDIDYPDQKKAFAFVRDCGRAIIPSYIPIVERNAQLGYSYSDRQWQLLRRGRYVEFNLIYDRGTKFGLVTPGARYESILMSLPLIARWEYQHRPEPNSKEDLLLQVLKNPKEWV